MKLIKKFESFQNSENILPLVKRLLEQMHKNDVIGFNNIELDDHQKLIIIKNKASIWVRETSLIGYYPGEIHVFFTLTDDGGIFDIKIDNVSFYESIIDILKKSIMIIERGKMKNVKNGTFSFPNTTIKKEESPKFNVNELKPEVRQRVLDIWSSFDK